MNTSSLLVIATASLSLLVGVGVGFLAGRQSGREAALAEIAVAPPPTPPAPAEPPPPSLEPAEPAPVANTTTTSRPNAPTETPLVVDAHDDEHNNSSSGQPRTHKVKPGDTLSRLAKLYKVDVGDIKKANNLRNDIIVVGKNLTIPPPEDPTPAAGTDEPEPPPPVASLPTTPSVVLSPGSPDASPGRVTVTPPGSITESAPVTPDASPTPTSAPVPEPIPPANPVAPLPANPEIAEPASPAAPGSPSPATPTSLPPPATPSAPGPDTLRLADTTPSLPPATAKPVGKVGTIPVEHQQMFTNTAGVGMRWDAATRSWRSMRDMKDEAEAMAKAAEWNEQVPASPHELSAKAANYHYEASGTRILLLPPGGSAPPAEPPARPATPPPTSTPPSASIPGTSQTPVSVPAPAVHPRPAPSPPPARTIIPLPKAMEKNFVIQSRNVGVTMAWDKEKRVWRSKDDERLRGLAFMLAVKLNEPGSAGSGGSGEVEKAARAAGYLYQADGPNRLVLSPRE